jgi:cysteine sulfinate desulfinase/cysteine desulfurase-like protein
MSLYANIHKKRKRIKEGSKEKMRKPGTKGAPTDAAFAKAKKTAKKPKKRTARA